MLQGIESSPMLDEEVNRLIELLGRIFLLEPGATPTTP